MKEINKKTELYYENRVFYMKKTYEEKYANEKIAQERYGAYDFSNRLANKLNKKLKMDKTGFISLSLVLISSFALFFAYLYAIDVFAFKEQFDVIYSLVFAGAVTLVPGIFSFKQRFDMNKKKEDL